MCKWILTQSFRQSWIVKYSQARCFQDSVADILELTTNLIPVFLHHAQGPQVFLFLGFTHFNIMMTNSLQVSKIVIDMLSESDLTSVGMFPNTDSACRCVYLAVEQWLFLHLWYIPTQHVMTTVLSPNSTPQNLHIGEYSGSLACAPQGIIKPNKTSSSV